MNAKLRAAGPMLLDLAIPIAGYFVLTTAGFTDFWALTLSGAATAVSALVNTIRRGRLDSLGTLVVLEIALSVLLLVLTRDARIVLLKPSFYTGLAGLYLLYTCLIGRPFTIETSKPFATRGDPERELAYDTATTHSPGFRRVHMQITAVWGVLWLVESVARVLVVLHSSIAQGVLAGQLPGIVAIALGLAYTRLRVPALRRHVTAHTTLSTSAAG